MLRYDLIIVGGGLVGAGLAAALASSGLRIALIDARVPSNDDPRLFALNHSSCRFLMNLGLWDALAARAAAIHQVHVSHQHQFGAVRLKREEAGVDALGHVIPARFIETALNDALTSLPHCTVYRPANLLALTQADGCATLEVETPQGTLTLQSSLVIGADGTASTVRSQASIQTETHDYGQNALVTVTQLQRSHQHIAYERFTANGAIAMLPLPDQQCATIWSADQATTESLMAASDAEFLQRLQKEFGYRLGRLQAIGKRHMFPLRFTRATKNVDQCVFLLGNSAHTLHPIAAQGFNLALYEVAVLVEGMLAIIRNHQPLTPDDLLRISTRTETQQRVSIGVSHHLSRAFVQPSAWKKAVIQGGMIGLDLSPLLKKKFMEGMLGKTGRVPRLLLEVNES